jgi:hypothetical protein
LGYFRKLKEAKLFAMTKNIKVKEHHGSRIHILNWVERLDFADQLSHLLCPTGAIIQCTDKWMPKGFCDPEEAHIEYFGPEILPEIDWKALHNWWLVYKRGANTPNWDLANTCTIQGEKGLVLIEAKAHTNELNTDGKRLALNASIRSHKNHEQICQAISEASHTLSEVVKGVDISCCTHYQLANRVAFSWKIASLGIPVILVYLGFLGDESWKDKFIDNNHWKCELRKYMDRHIPEDFIDQWICCGKSKMQTIIRSLPIEKCYNSEPHTEI